MRAGTSPAPTRLPGETGTDHEDPSRIIERSPDEIGATWQSHTHRLLRHDRSGFAFQEGVWESHVPTLSRSDDSRLLSEMRDTVGTR